MVELTATSFGSDHGETVFDYGNGMVNLRIPTIRGNSRISPLVIFVHEAVHAYQFEMGTISLKLWDSENFEIITPKKADGYLLFSDWQDEVEAYTRDEYFGGNGVPEPYPSLPLEQVTIDNYPYFQPSYVRNNLQVIKRGVQVHKMAIRISINGEKQTIY